MRCVAYIRVSTVEQDENVQREAIARFAGEKGIEILGWYVDKGESGGKAFASRPAAQELLKSIETLKPDCIVSWSIDRLGRRMADIMSTVAELEARGIKIITIREEFLQILDANVRQLILSILAWVAEFERRRMRERIEEAWRMGKQKGRPKKISDETIKAYLRKYRGLKIKAIWKIMKMDGKDISYYWLIKRIKKLGYKQVLETQ